MKLKTCANFTNSQKLNDCIEKKAIDCDFNKATECKNILNCQKIPNNDNIDIDKVFFKFYLFLFILKGLDYQCTSSFTESKMIGSNRNIYKYLKKKDHIIFRLFFNTKFRLFVRI